MVTVASVETGEVLSPLGPFHSAGEARVACAQVVGSPLAWRREELDWAAEAEGMVYRVPADDVTVDEACSVPDYA